jgi:succinate dehydrogenase / fumarate reductase cytochrome b subunit
MQDRYAYYPGCLASLSAKELDTSTRAVAAKLEVELVEMESTTCCGAGDIHEAKPDYYLHLNARILSQAEGLGCDTLLTICNVCTLNLRQANKRLRERPEELARINANLEQVGAAPYSGNVDVRHLLWELSEGDGLERFKQIAVKSLTGLKVAPFYGCQILRPSKVLGFEDPDSPSSLERLIEACGAEAIDYPAKVKCCGFPIILAREDVALGEAILPLSEAADAGADVMVTPCPLCHLSLDAWQNKAEKKAGRSFNMPVLHLAQLLGAAAGIREDELKFTRHVVRLPASTKRKLLPPDEVPEELPAGAASTS